MRKIYIAFFVFAGVSWPSLVMADGTLTPQHGGRMVEADGSRLELVTGGGKVELYVTDHGDKPVAVGQVSAKVVLLIGGKKQEVALQAAGDNLLSGKIDMAGGEKAAAVITVEGLPKRITARLPAYH